MPLEEDEPTEKSPEKGAALVGAAAVVGAGVLAANLVGNGEEPPSATAAGAPVVEEAARVGAAPDAKPEEKMIPDAESVEEMDVVVAPDAAATTSTVIDDKKLVDAEAGRATSKQGEAEGDGNGAEDKDAKQERTEKELEDDRRRRRGKKILWLLLLLLCCLGVILAIVLPIVLLKKDDDENEEPTEPTMPPTIAPSTMAPSTMAPTTDVSISFFLVVLGLLTNANTNTQTRYAP